jgi:hypothetical protein
MTDPLLASRSCASCAWLSLSVLSCFPGWGWPRRVGSGRHQRRVFGPGGCGLSLVVACGFSSGGWPMVVPFLPSWSSRGALPDLRRVLGYWACQGLWPDMVAKLILLHMCVCSRPTKLDDYWGSLSRPKFH